MRTGRKIRARFAARVVLAAAVLCTGAGAAAATCSPDDFARAVDKAGAELRAFNAEEKPKLASKLDELGARKGWATATREERGYEYLADTRIAAVDAKANDLLGNVDDLGSVRGDAEPNCARLIELAPRT